eukprot:5620989-Pyramimonas_sp.AAC.1
MDLMGVGNSGGDECFSDGGAGATGGDGGPGGGEARAFAADDAPEGDGDDADRGDSIQDVPTSQDSPPIVGQCLRGCRGPSSADGHRGEATSDGHREGLLQLAIARGAATSTKRF